MLVDMPFGAFPMALGVIYDDPAPTFESAVREQNEQAAPARPADLQALVSKGQSWMVTKEPHAIYADRPAPADPRSTASRHRGGDALWP
jgi:2-oxoglutarate ferredoxin oxidoreductase subunit beta